MPPYSFIFTWHFSSATSKRHNLIWWPIRRGVAEPLTRKKVAYCLIKIQITVYSYSYSVPWHEHLPNMLWISKQLYSTWAKMIANKVWAFSVLTFDCKMHVSWHEAKVILFKQSPKYKSESAFLSSPTSRKLSRGQHVKKSGPPWVL